MDTHAEQPGVSWLLHRTISLQYREWIPALRITGFTGRRVLVPTPASVRMEHGPSLTAPTCTGAGTPLLLFLQGAGPNGPATDAAGASSIKNEDYALFAQDKWQVRPNFTLNYGLRWEAQIFPDVTVAPSQTAYGFALSDPRFPSDGTLHSPKERVSAAGWLCLGYFQKR